MPRVSILDSILNRPSQSYAAPEMDRDPRAASVKWAPPSDLPNARQESSSILSGSMFRKKSGRIDGAGSDAGRSTSGSTVGRSTTRSRFGRKKRESIMPGHYAFDQDDVGSQAGASSVAGSSATASKRKSRWWESGSLGFGRRSRASSIAGDSIFSEPDRGNGPDWSGMAGIGAGANRGRVARSDFGGSPSRPSMVPPMPKLDSRIHSAAPPGRLQSSVAPLGASTLNPTLTQKTSKSRMTSASHSSLKRPSVAPNRASSPPPQMHSPPMSESGRSSLHKQRNSQDWKDFVNSMSGSDISKAWEGSRGDVSSMEAALKRKPGTQGVERRRSNVVRLQRELEQEAQFEQVVRDPGVIHQDLLARAASQVVGNPPAAAAMNQAELLGSHIRPGSIVSPLPTDRARSPPPERSLSPPLNRASSPPPQPSRNPAIHGIIGSGPPSHSPLHSPPRLAQSPLPAVPTEKEESHESSEEEEEDGDDDETSSSEESEESVSRQQPLEAVDEEEEESSSVGHEMKPHPVAVSATAPTNAKYLAFEAVLSRGQSSASKGQQSVPVSPLQAHKSTEMSPSVDDASTSPPEVAAPTQLITSATPESAAKEDSNSVEELEEISDSQSIRSVQTGKATVKFDEDVKPGRRDSDTQSLDSSGTASRPRSMASSIRASSRPPTLSRRLSDLSLGTSFGVSGIFGGQSRSPSSRGVKVSDGDSDSAKSGSDDEGDAELKEKIKVEQERLRSMKVGDDFFGGSLSTILDKFGKTGWDEEVSNTVGHLDLNVGPSSKGAKRESTQEILNNNAQERINEVRRLRSEGAPSSRSRRDNSDSMTVQSGIAPSFAALWLLNEGEAKQPADSPTAARLPASFGKGHARQLSGASSEGGSSSTHGSASARIRNFFGVGSPLESVEKKKPSVMDRPRNRSAKPKEMGGVPISQGRLSAEEKAEEVEDVRSTFPALLSSQTLSQMKEAKEVAEVSPLVSPPGSPTPKPADVPSSRDKPAPVKSALKPKASKSLADTLFSFATPSSPEKKKKAEEKKTNETLQLTGAPPSVWSMKEKRVTKAEKKAEKKILDGKKMLDEKKEGKEKVVVVENAREQHTPPRQAVPASTSVYMTPEKSSDASSLDSSPESSPERPRPHMPTYQTALDFNQERKEERLAKLERPVKGAMDVKSESSDEEWKTPLGDSARSPAMQQMAIAGPTPEERAPSSELWSGESVLSTGPTTPGASDILEKVSLPLTSRRAEETTGEKKLPMPPTPTFDDSVLLPPLEGEATPLAISHQDPIHIDQNKTPMAEVREPSFGMNLIPPTPPALESRTSYTANTSKAPTGGAQDTLVEQLDEEDSNEPTTMQRSTSKSKMSSRKSDADLSRKSSKKKGTSVSTEYQGLSLPPGLVATTVASSASRASQRPSTGTSDPSTDGTIQRKKSKGKRSLDKPSRTYADALPAEGDPAVSSRRSSLALSQSLAGAPPVPDLPHSMSNLAIPSSRSETNSSAGSSSVAISRSGSASPSPAPSASGRSAVSSNASLSAASDHSTGQPYRRAIRTLSMGPNGQAKTTLMSSISEWESSPMSGRDGSVSPVTPYTGSPIPASLVSRSQSSINTGPSPSLIRNAPMGAPADSYLRPIPRALSSRAESLDGHGMRASATSYLGGESDSSLNGTQSVLSLPSVPQSSYRAQDPMKASNAIDDRLYAKTTMATVAVTSGAFRSKSLRKRKSSVDLGHAADDGRRGSRISIDTVPEGLTEELHRTTMSLTAHTPPPRKLASTQVLVQVIACAIDESDRLILREKIRSESAFGFVPGRSFSGRVMETGWEVKRMRKGDMIFGLQNSRKCGALAEFMTIDQDLLAKAPEDCLTTEQIAALPSVGVLAYQMMINHCSQLKRGSRILILNAHDGVGLLTMQESANLGLIIVAHCPDSVSDGITLCEANGAHEVIVGDALWALNSLHESSFDLVLDTVGGRRIYDASRRILAFDGQFCTCVGDMQSSSNPNLKSHLRSLRRSFFKKDTKRIGYEWIGTDMGEDCREALEAVKLAAEKGQVCPRLQSILSFGEAPRAFESTLRGGETEPGSIVVRVS